MTLIYHGFAEDLVNAVEALIDRVMDDGHEYFSDAELRKIAWKFVNKRFDVQPIWQEDEE